MDDHKKVSIFNAFEEMYARHMERSSRPTQNNQDEADKTENTAENKAENNADVAVEVAAPQSVQRDTEPDQIEVVERVDVNSEDEAVFRKPVAMKAEKQKAKSGKRSLKKRKDIPVESAVTPNPDTPAPPQAKHSQKKRRIRPEVDSPLAVPELDDKCIHCHEHGRSQADCRIRLSHTAPAWCIHDSRESKIVPSPQAVLQARKQRTREIKETKQREGRKARAARAKQGQHPPSPGYWGVDPPVAKRPPLPPPPPPPPAAVARAGSRVDGSVGAYIEEVEDLSTVLSHAIHSAPQYTHTPAAPPSAPPRQIIPNQGKGRAERAVDSWLANRYPEPDPGEEISFDTPSLPAGEPSVFQLLFPELSVFED